MHLDKSRIVLVDDCKDARDVIAEVLRRYGAEVITLGSAKEAIESVRQAPPDVIITDISMPQEDGVSLLRSIRRLPAEQGGQVPAVALTAHADPAYEARLLSIGFQMHVAKPVDPLQFPSLLDTLVGKSRT
jgi:CheY-like chemotaxis protein